MLAAVPGMALMALLDPQPPELDDRQLEIASWIIGVAGFVLVGLVLCLPLAPHLLRRGRRLRVESAVDVLREDRRPPVLLLRSFEDDDLVNPTPRFFWFLGRRRYEADLAKVLRRVGPPITIGRPGALQPELGAARLYVHAEDWQKAVRYFMARSALIVMVVGRSTGIWWEIREAAALGLAQRLLFFFPYVEQKRARESFWRNLYLYLRAVPTTYRQLRFMREEHRKRYEIFRVRGEALFHHPLPETLGEAQFLAFSASGQARLLRTVGPPLARLLAFSKRSKRTHIDFRRTLNPIVSGAPYARTPKKRRRPAASGSGTRGY